MIWMLTVFAIVFTDLPVLMPNEPVIGKVGAGETLKFRLTIPQGQRAMVTLLPLDGDADLFVSLPAEVPISKTPFKSNNPALHVERVALPKQVNQEEGIVSVFGATESKFVLNVNFTSRSVIFEPKRLVLTEIQWQEIAFSEDNFLGALTIANKTSTWYEVSVKSLGFDECKIHMPSSFVLGPKGKRYLGWVSLKPNSRIVVTFQRTPKADAFLIADCVSRLVAGVAISPEIDIAIDDLMPKIQPLLSVAQALREGDWKRASVLLMANLRSNPQTLTSLHAFLQRTGIRLPKDIFGSRIASGFGAISAAVSAMAAVNLPKREQVTIFVK
ncbi:MAG: hypothetical protein NZ805_05955 [Armatimonadetes bacterium]|nr:hypothetical protein [Armatimonadota bacterium]MDW8029581.1 hypothetical protein [Armatimonadota bacterium]